MCECAPRVWWVRVVQDVRMCAACVVGEEGW